MASIIENINVNVDKNFSKNLFNTVKEFFNQPKWLKTLLVIVILLGTIYFGYSYYHDNSEVKDLLEQVIIINEEITKNVSNTEFKENLNYLITGLKMLEQLENQSFSDELLEIDLIIRFMEKYYPNEPVAHDLYAMKNRLIVNHEAYVLNYTFYMNQLTKHINDSIK